MNKFYQVVITFLLTTGYLIPIYSAEQTIKIPKASKATVNKFKIVESTVPGSDMYSNIFLTYSGRCLYNTEALSTSATIKNIGTVHKDNIYLLEYAPGGNACEISTQLVVVDSLHQIKIYPSQGICVEPEIILKPDSMLILKYNYDSFRPAVNLCFANGVFADNNTVIPPEKITYLLDKPVFPSLLKANGIHPKDVLSKDTLLQNALKEMLKDKFYDFTDRLSVSADDMSKTICNYYSGRGFKPHGVGYDEAFLYVDIFLGSIFIAILYDGEHIDVYGSKSEDDLPTDIKNWINSFELDNVNYIDE
ncbi:MAG: hypothetical protein GXX85_06140 [Ignavibacteria bacterium]|nr:hypothetical protein [Ignavibacteria bacterium]